MEQANQFLHDTLMPYFQTLNVLFIITFILICFGIKYNSQFEWVRKLIKNEYNRNWIVGIPILLFYFVFQADFTSQTFWITHRVFLGSLLESYIFVLIFNNVLVDLPFYIIDSKLRFFNIKSNLTKQVNDEEEFIKQQVQEQVQEQVKQQIETLNILETDNLIDDLDNSDTQIVDNNIDKKEER